MIYKLYQNTGQLPYRNIAIEKYLFDTCLEDEIILYLWINDPSVIAGCNQNVFLEWNNDFLKEKGIYPVRRLSGGGCVYHDRGNLNYSFISSIKHKDIEKWLEIILDSVSSFGFKAVKSGRNDLCIDGKKFSGTAWLEEDDKILFHGTLLIDVDRETLQRALTPRQLKFEGKSIKSVKSRVINLKELSEDYTSKDLEKEIINTFEKTYGKLENMTITTSSELEKIEEKLKSKEWIFARNSDCDISLTYKFKSALVNLDLEIKDNFIKNVNVFTDSLDINIVTIIKKELIGIKYSDSDIKSLLEKILD